MGGGKRKYPTRQKYTPEEKKLGKYSEEKKEPLKEEDMKPLLELWQNSVKKKIEKKDSENI